MEKKDFLELFDVKFVNLKPGRHLFNYQIENEFLEYFENSLLDEIEINVQLELDKQNVSLFILYFKLDGTINLECDRCLEEINLSVHSDQKLVLKIVPDKNSEEYDEEIIFVSNDEHKVNVANAIFEFLQMEVPLRKTCDMVDLECNQEMLHKIDQVNINEDNTDIDPRWNELKNLKNI